MVSLCDVRPWLQPSRPRSGLRRRAAVADGAAGGWWASRPARRASATPARCCANSPVSRSAPSRWSATPRRWAGTSRVTNARLSSPSRPPLRPCIRGSTVQAYRCATAKRWAAPASRPMPVPRPARSSSSRCGRPNGATATPRRVAMRVASFLLSPRGMRDRGRGISPPVRDGRAALAPSPQWERDFASRQREMTLGEDGPPARFAYCTTERGVGTTRVTWMRSRSMRSTTFGATSFFQKSLS